MTQLTEVDIDFYSHSLSVWINDNIEYPDSKEIDAIRSLWNYESWEDIVEKFNTQGSIWIVWWHDGIKAYASKDI